MTRKHFFNTSLVVFIGIIFMPEYLINAYTFPVTAFDSTAAFHNLAYGVNEAAGSLAAVMIAAEAIGRSRHRTLPKQVLTNRLTTSSQLSYQQQTYYRPRRC